MIGQLVICSPFRRIGNNSELVFMLEYALIGYKILTIGIKRELPIESEKFHMSKTIELRHELIVPIPKSLIVQHSSERRKEALVKSLIRGK